MSRNTQFCTAIKERTIRTWLTKATVGSKLVRHLTKHVSNFASILLFSYVVCFVWFIQVALSTTVIFQYLCSTRSLAVANQYRVLFVGDQLARMIVQVAMEHFTTVVPSTKHVPLGGILASRFFGYIFSGLFKQPLLVNVFFCITVVFRCLVGLPSARISPDFFSSFQVFYKGYNRESTGKRSNLP